MPEVTHRFLGSRAKHYNQEVQTLVLRGISEAEDGVVLIIGDMGYAIPMVIEPDDRSKMHSIGLSFEAAREMAEFILEHMPVGETV